VTVQASLVRQWTATTFDNVRRDFRLIKGDTPADPCEFIPVQVRCAAACRPPCARVSPGAHDGTLCCIAGRPVELVFEVSLAALI
jgi:hypothetical protein